MVYKNCLSKILKVYVVCMSLILFVFVCMYLYTTCTWVPLDAIGPLDTLEMTLQAVINCLMYVMGTEFES